MSNLVPEPRVDVNGHVVTRHVRPEAASTTPSRPVPKVAGGARSDVHRAVSELVYGTIRDYEMMRIYSPIHNVNVHLNRRSISEYFSGIPKDIVDECLTQLISSETDQGYANLLVSVVRQHEDQDMLSNMTFLYDPDSENASHVEWDHGKAIAKSHAFIRKIIKGIDKYTQWGIEFPHRLTLASVEDQQKALALYKATDHLVTFDLHQKDLAYDRDENGLVTAISLKKKSLFEVVTAHTDRIDEIVSLMESRGTDGVLLAEYLAGNPPLRNGLL